MLFCMLVCIKWARNIVKIIWLGPSRTSWDKL